MKVQIVDDSSFIILVCRQALQKSGYQVVAESYNGEEAVEHAKEFEPDVIIMDIAMPKKNGLEATEEILEVLPKTKIIAVSAVDESWVKEKAQQAGCFEFLAKPFDTLKLVNIIEGIKEQGEELKYG